MRILSRNILLSILIKNTIINGLQDSRMVGSYKKIDRQTLFVRRRTYH